MIEGATFLAGDTFRPSDRVIDIHLWVIISDPLQDPSRILIVSLTTYKPYKEAACLLQKGDHRAISHETCIAYDLAKVTTIEQLQEAATKGLLRSDLPVGTAILKRIREGAALSRKMSIEHFELLDAQGLL